MRFGEVSFRSLYALLNEASSSDRRLMVPAHEPTSTTGDVLLFTIAALRQTFFPPQIYFQ